MQQERRQTLADLSNVPRRLTILPAGKGGGRRPSMAAPQSVLKAPGGNRPSRPSGRGDAESNRALDPRDLTSREWQRRVKEAVIVYASSHGFSETLDVKVGGALPAHLVTVARCAPFLSGRDACRCNLNESCLCAWGRGGCTTCQAQEPR